MSRRRKVTRYVPRHHYTPEELDECQIMDDQVDLACAFIDGMNDYAAELRVGLDKRLTAFFTKHGRSFTASANHRAHLEQIERERPRQTPALR